MDINLDVNKLYQEQLAIRRGLEKYRFIMERVNQTDLTTDADFQRTFNGFYRVRGNEAWRKEFYKHFESVKCGTPTFESILTHLYERTGRIEASFSSKMLATIFPDKPIWDRFVLQNLNLQLDGRTKTVRLSNAVTLYAEIERWYEEYLQTEQAQACLQAFDRAMPEYTFISSTKKIDFILWRMR